MKKFNLYENLLKEEQVTAKIAVLASKANSPETMTKAEKSAFCALAVGVETKYQPTDDELKNAIPKWQWSNAVMRYTQAKLRAGETLTPSDIELVTERNRYLDETIKGKTRAHAFATALREEGKTETERKPKTKKETTETTETETEN